MFIIRKYRDDDFSSVSTLIQQVFSKFILPDATSEGRDYWSAFHSLSVSNQENIRGRFKSCPIRFVAELNYEVVGTVMGNSKELSRIFVSESCHRKGLGEKLIKSFEAEMKMLDVKHYKITSSLYAVHFYTKMGCKKSTGIRNFHGLRVQPMKRYL